jgi:hypothetical protein
MLGPKLSILQNFFFLVFGWDWTLNAGRQAYKAGGLLLELHLQALLFWLFWRQNLTICLG